MIISFSFNYITLLLLMPADCCMPWCWEWCTMKAKGRWRLLWFIRGSLCVLPSFHLGKACVTCLRPHVQPTTNHLSTRLSLWIISGWGYFKWLFCACLLGSHLWHGIIFPCHLGAGRAQQSSRCHGWVVCVMSWNQGSNHYFIQVSTVWCCQQLVIAV